LLIVLLGIPIYLAIRKAGNLQETTSMQSESLPAQTTD
jgi:hypothetical protein